MTSNIRRHGFAALALLSGALSGAFGSGAQVHDASALVEPGVVLEVFDAGSPAHRTGLQSGDILLSWKRTTTIVGRPSAGTFQSPLDWRVFELEEAPRAPYLLTVQRGSKRFTVVASAGIWTGHNIDTTVRPRFVGRGLDAWERGLSAVGQSYGPDFIDGMILGELRVGGQPVGKRPRPDTPDVVDERLHAWRELADDLHRTGDYDTEASLRWRMTWEIINAAGSWPPSPGKPDPIPPILERAKQEFSRALSALPADSDARYRGALYTLYLHEIYRTNNQGRERARFDEALQLIEREQPDSLMLATVLHYFYIVHAGKNFAAARPAAERALSMRRRHSPDSAEMALVLADASNVFFLPADQWDAASGRLRESWDLIVKVAPFTNEAVEVIQKIDLYFQLRGDLPQIERMARHVVQSYERWRPLTRFFPMVETTLVDVLIQRGKLSEAGDLAMRALKHANDYAARRSAAGLRPIRESRSAKAVGDVALAKGDLATAERWYSEALKAQPTSDAVSWLADVYEARGQEAHAEDLRRRLVPPGSTHNGMVPILTRLAEMELSKTNLAAAETLLQRAIEYAEQFMVGSLPHVEALRVSAAVAMRRGDQRTALARYAEALSAIEKKGSGTMAHADVLQAQADMFREKGDLGAAQERYRRAIEIRLRLAPQTSSEALSRHGLAMTMKAAGRLTEAEKEFSAAVAALEAQMGRAGLAELSRSGVAGRSARVYSDYIDLLLDAGRHEEAFHVLERSRARSFLAGLAERDVRFTADIPPPLSAERAQAEARYDVLQAEIGRLGSTDDAAKISRLISELHLQRTILDGISARIRATSPRAATPRYPKALSTKQIEASLDPGTVFLSYAVSAKGSTLFVITKNSATAGQPVTAIRIAAGDEELRRQVEAFRSLIAWKRPAADVTARARSLYDLLIQPAEPHIAGASRVVISVDGPLLSLPFAALVRPSPPDRPEYLVQWKPLHHVMSATVYAEMRRTRPVANARPVSIVAFGDPRYPAIKPKTDPVRSEDEPNTRPPGDVVPASPAEEFDPEVDVETRSGSRLAPLPGSADEVRAIAALYGTRAKTFLGEAATEERARSVGRDVSVLHFAVHGLTNDRLPLNSALALSIPDRVDPTKANGLLQAWEIYDNIRLNADLVTLSACETAIGKEMRGEGLIGLSRAFLFAGAKTVLASLWKVTDRSTSELMVRFYTSFRKQPAKDEALRDAQLQAIRSANYAHPYYWAAFQLYGDWH